MASEGEVGRAPGDGGSVGDRGAAGEPGAGAMTWRGRPGDAPWLLAEETAVGTVAFTARHRGVSAGPYDSLNLAFHVDDEPRAVVANRRAAAAALEVASTRMTFVRQVHGTAVAVIGPGTVGVGAEGPSAIEADAAVTAVPGAAVGVLVADCAAVLVSDEHRRAVGAVHAGWRGVYEGVLPAALEAMAARFGSDPASLRLWVGPHARACCYEVSEELAARFAGRFGASVVSTDGRLDLEACLRSQWTAAGVVGARVTSVPLCTMCRPDLLFSHRRAADGVTGRFAGIATLAG